MNSEAPALVIDGLVVRYGARQVVDEVSLTIGRGELVAVVGESGCGKTSTAMASVGLVKAAAGEVRVAGADLTRARGSRRRQILRSIQLICQDPYEALDPRFTVGQVVAEPLLVHRVGGNARERRALVLDALQRAGIPSPETYLDRYPHQLSGGQLQRVAIATAIVLDPLMLIADEPVSMLDVSLRAGVLRLFAALRDAGLGIMMITHDLVTAAHYADRIAVMYAGRIVEEGSPAAIIGAPKHPYTGALLAALPDPDRARRAPRALLPGEPPDLLNLPPGCRFRPRCPQAHDECARTDPKLEAHQRAEGAEPRRVACIRAGELDLAVPVHVALSATVPTHPGGSTDE